MLVITNTKQNAATGWCPRCVSMTSQAAILIIRATVEVGEAHEPGLTTLLKRGLPCATIKPTHCHPFFVKPIRDEMWVLLSVVVTLASAKLILASERFDMASYALVQAGWASTRDQLPLQIHYLSLWLASNPSTTSCCCHTQQAVEHQHHTSRTWIYVAFWWYQQSIWGRLPIYPLQNGAVFSCNINSLTTYVTLAQFFDKLHSNFHNFLIFLLAANV